MLVIVKKIIKKYKENSSKIIIKNNLIFLISNVINN